MGTATARVRKNGLLRAIAIASRASAFLTRTGAEAKKAGTVHSIHRPARAGIFQVNAGHSLPDVTPLRGLFQLELFCPWHGKARRRRRQFPVARTQAACLV